MAKLSNEQEMLQKIIDMGARLSTEPNIEKLLELILELSQSLIQADGGTLYRLTEDNTLRFAMVRNHKLNIAMGGENNPAIDTTKMMDLPLSIDGKPNHKAVAAYAANTKETVVIEDAYTVEGFDFSGAKRFDEAMGYRTQSVLAIPLIDHEGKILGVLQFINALNEDKETIPFSKFFQDIAQSLASQAAISLRNRLLINQLNELFEALINLINTAIDEKSPYTGGHCMRVPDLTLMIAEATHRENEGPMSDFKLEDKDRYELKIAGMLHDCGKITTPVHVVDKGKKLETIYDKIGLIETRFESLLRDSTIRYYQGLQEGKSPADKLKQSYEEEQAQIRDDITFLKKCNVGGERMKEDDIARIQAIATYQWTDHEGQLQPALSEDEVYNLSIVAGTLTKEEREIINHHIVATIKLLNQIPWPEHLKNVVEYAGGHHEKMDGTGYPNQLKREDMSVQARCMGIADIFEALTASDRPYKKGMPLSQSLKIMGRMKEEAHIDADLFDIFVKQKIYMDYANKFLGPEQIDID